ncbi:hypothetical protein D6C95_02437, partial [Aureobasidium pullulans]
SLAFLADDPDPTQHRHRHLIYNTSSLLPYSLSPSSNQLQQSFPSLSHSFLSTPSKPTNQTPNPTIKMKSFGVIALAASASAAYINGTAPANGTVYTTEIVTALTTYCPAATTVVQNGKTYTVSSATTLTITDCPCTVVKTMAPSATGSSNGTASATKPAIYTGAANNVVAAGYGLAALGAAVVLL